MKTHQAATIETRLIQLTLLKQKTNKARPTKTRNKERRKEEANMTQAGNSISMNDVLCGRGGATNNHVGNKKFRLIVAEYQEEYLNARKKDKSGIAKQIVARVHQNGGRFLKRDQSNNTWVEVTTKKATEKTSQALREGLDVKHKTYRPEKMIRRDSNESEETNPRKRPRLVTGTVSSAPSAVVSPGLHPMGGNGDSIPDLNEEQHNLAGHAGFVYFQPKAISRSDCDDIAAV